MSGNVEPDRLGRNQTGESPTAMSHHFDPMGGHLDTTGSQFGAVQSPPDQSAAPPTRHKMRPPSNNRELNKIKQNCFPKMSKKEKRFDPAKACVPRLMPEEHFTINTNLPHQKIEYFQGITHPYES